MGHGQTNMLTNVTTEPLATDEHSPAYTQICFEVPSPDAVELRRLLRSVRALSRNDVSVWKAKQLWQPVSAGGPILFDWYEARLLAAFKDQVPVCIRRMQASKPVSVRIRKIIDALLALERLRRPD